MNKYHKGTYSGGEGGSNAAQGRKPSLDMPEKTANWPGVPGKTQGKSRSGGAPTTGYRGAPFQHKKIGL